MIKKSIVLAIAALTLTCCTSNAPVDPIRAAITERVQAQTGEGTKVTFEQVSLIDSCSFATEIAHRIHAFELKYGQDSLYCVKYRNAGQMSKSKEKAEAMLKDKEFIKKIEAIKADLGDKVNEIAYYDYVFSAKGKTADGAALEMKDYYLCITPDGRVLSMVDNKKLIHKGTGKVIPGYADMFGGQEDAGE